MPTYEYRCNECGHPFEVWATIANKEKGLDLVCEKCGSTAMQQVFSGISFVTGTSDTRNTSFGRGGCSSGSGCCS